MKIDGPTEVRVYVPTQGRSMGTHRGEGADAEVATLYGPDPG